MRKGVLRTLGWVIAAVGLYLAVVVLELYWNFYDWQPRVDVLALGLLLGIFGSLAAIYFLARNAGQSLIRFVSLALCLALLALAIYILPSEPLTSGLFARQTASPLWYRSGRLLVLGLPMVFWSLNAPRFHRFNR